MKQLVIIGGSDAGISAALRAREADPTWNVRLVVADRFPNYSICGLPFYLSGGYTPPLSSPWDPVQTSCMEWARPDAAP
jgi:NADPH-dependent 2,4-dienoyl-CoA reductase/sulfur reductase-like enzyme